MTSDAHTALSHYAWDPRHELGGQPAAHHRLTVAFRAPSAEEKRAFSAASVMQFALYIEDDAIVLLYKTATSAWSDAPYSWHLQQPGAAPGVSDPGGRAVPFDCWLYDTRDMRKPVAGVRHAVPWEFMRELHRAIAAQSQQSFDKARYEATIARLAKSECEALVTRSIARARAGGR